MVPDILILRLVLRSRAHGPARPTTTDRPTDRRSTTTDRRSPTDDRRSATDANDRSATDRATARRPRPAIFLIAVALGEWIRWGVVGSGSESGGEWWPRGVNQVGSGGGDDLSLHVECVRFGTLSGGQKRVLDTFLIRCTEWEGRGCASGGGDMRVGGMDLWYSKSGSLVHFGTVYQSVPIWYSLLRLVQCTKAYQSVPKMYQCTKPCVWYSGRGWSLVRFDTFLRRFGRACTKRGFGTRA